MEGAQPSISHRSGESLHLYKAPIFPWCDFREMQGHACYGMATLTRVSSSKGKLGIVIYQHLLYSAVSFAYALQDFIKLAFQESPSSRLVFFPSLLEDIDLLAELLPPESETA